MNIGENIKKYRKLKKLSQQSLSDLSGVPRVSISRYESGERTPNVDIVAKIATALQIPIDFLIGSELTAMEIEGTFNGFIDSQFGFFNPEDEHYMDFIERKLSRLDNYKKDNMFIPPCYPSFSSELVTNINRSICKDTPAGVSISNDSLNQIIFNSTGVEDIWNVRPDKELALTDLIKLLDFYNKFYKSDFKNFIFGSSFGFSDLDPSIQEILNDYKHSLLERISIPGGFISKPDNIDMNLAYSSLVNLIFYIHKENTLVKLNDKDYRSLLMKVCDLLEFELFKLDKKDKNKDLDINELPSFLRDILNEKGEDDGK